MSSAHSLSAPFHFMGFVRRELTRQFNLLPEMVAGADLVVGTSLAFGLATVAERLGISYRYIAFTPQLLPSARHPFMTFKHQGFPEWWNRLTWRIVSAVDRINLTRMINDRRRAWGLPFIPDAWPHILSPRVMVAADAEIYPLPPDRETDASQTGYLHLDQPDVPLPALEAFLDKGPAPVYAGFGSMPRRDQARNVSLLVRAARVAGRRVIIGRFWKGITPFDRADDVFFLKGYPHLRLFPPHGRGRPSWRCRDHGYGRGQRRAAGDRPPYPGPVRLGRPGVAGRPRAPAGVAIPSDLAEAGPGPEGRPGPGVRQGGRRENGPGDRPGKEPCPGGP